MNPGDPNVARVEVVAEALGDRPVIVEEVAAAESGLRAYLAVRFRELTRNPDFANALPGLVAYDDLYESRIQAVRNRTSAIAGLESP